MNNHQIDQNNPHARDTTHAQAHTQEQSLKKILTIGLSVFFALLLIGLLSSLIRLSMIQNERAELMRLSSSLNSQIIAQQDQSSHLTSDDFINRYAREQLGMIGRDESAFVVVW